MSTVQMRPTFLLETELSAQETMRCVKESFSKSQSPAENDASSDASCIYCGQFARDHAMISIVESERHFWSPWMHVEIRGAESGHHVFGRFSPHPSIWTGFMFSYLAIGVIVFFAAMFGVSQQLSGQSPWAYYIIPAGLLIALILWFAAKAGQKLALDEMREMKSRIERCLQQTRTGQSSIEQTAI